MNYILAIGILILSYPKFGLDVGGGGIRPDPALDSERVWLARTILFLQGIHAQPCSVRHPLTSLEGG